MNGHLESKVDIKLQLHLSHLLLLSLAALSQVIFYETFWKEIGKRNFTKTIIGKFQISLTQDVHCFSTFGRLLEDREGTESMGRGAPGPIKRSNFQDKISRP